jgi:hypothetical protein
MLKAKDRRPKKAGRGRDRPARAYSATYGPVPRPGTSIIPIHFEIGGGVVSIILENGDRCPLFPSQRITGKSVFPTVRESLQQTVATIMEDMGAEDNGVV